ncbi:MAG TPA: SusD/RagB family nutrient-binding outer membrane lipoprotein [Mucilaginibacter sp.]|nr:SusD/RagB family nutrient-binding outer membrane lipoprotein [Mucilaginibacter sp.]
MKIRSLIPAAILVIGLVSVTGCQKGDLVDNPNVAGATGTVPASLLLNHLTSALVKNPGYGNTSNEMPFTYSTTAGQYVLSNYQYYRGNNAYNFGNTNDSYDILKYALALETQSTQQQGNQTNKYYALAQFFKAYAGIWLTERVGDIPFSQAGNSTILQPKYDTQHDVYASCLALLDKANSVLAPLAAANAGAKIDAGDIFGLTYLQWQKVINTYTLRVLVSLSKRAGDNADLQISQKFANILGSPTTYPIMASNADNVVYQFNAAFNPYPIFQYGDQPYNNFANIGEAFINATAPNQDPRLYIVATPAPLLVAGGKQVSDFTAYAGSNDNLTLPDLLNNSNNGQYSYTSYNRYYTSTSGALAEPFIFIGYPEMCFNIAEGINRGWATGNSAQWYTNGINASMANFGITNGQVVAIGYPVSTTNTTLNPQLIPQGGTWGTATVNLTQFMANVAYAGDNAAGLAQIFTQRYVAMFANSGWEPYYNWRRSVDATHPNGIPAWDQGGAGIGTGGGNLVPRRWLYPANEAAYNTTNYKSAIQSQFGGTDDITKDTWLTK